MATKLANKVAVITASTDGLGFAIAQRLARDGCKVVVSSRREENVKKAVDLLKSENLEAHGLVCHAGKAEDRTRLINETVSKYGGIDYLVTNAAVNPHVGPTFDITEALWDKIYDVNVKSTFFMIKEAIPHLKQRKGASIITISSAPAYTPGIGMSIIRPYLVSKATVLALTKALTSECAEMGIRINCVAPGVFRTNFSKVIWNADKDRTKYMLQNIALKRFGEPEECAGIVSFLLSDDASYITGENFVVAGGYTSSRI